MLNNPLLACVSGGFFREGCNSDMGSPIPKNLVIWVSPVTLTLTQIAKVIWEGDAHITVTEATASSEATRRKQRSLNKTTSYSG